MLAKNRQAGLSLVGAILLMAMVGACGLVVAKTIPSFVEFRAIQNYVKGAAATPSIDDIKRGFNRTIVIDDITSIAADDLVFTKEGDVIVTSFSYKKEIPLVGPVSLLINYAGSSKGL
jgi:hypothetical protein